MKIAAILGSTRSAGNTEQLAQLVLKDLPCTYIDLKKYHITPIVDKRHTAEGFSPINDDHDTIITTLLDHDIVVFVTPIYWYGMSCLMKNFVDRWSQTLRDNRFKFKESMTKKKGYVLIVGGDNPRIKGLPLVEQYKHALDFVGIPFAGYILGEANKPGEIMQDAQALIDAAQLNKELHAMIGAAR